MSLSEKVNEIILRNSAVSDEELAEILKENNSEPIKEAVLKGLDYPNLNALTIAYHVPDKLYEQKLLFYKQEEMSDSQATYWMLTLGEICSEKAFDKIKPYTRTGLYHPAFVALGKIDLSKTVELFADFLNSDKANNPFYTMVILLKFSEEPEKVVADISNKCSGKKDFFDKALKQVRTYTQP